jgi:hypothetical protein
MSSSIIISQSPTQPTAPPADQNSPMAWSNLWGSASIVLLIGIIALAIYGKLELDKRDRSIRLEQYKTKDVQKKLKLALTTIKKMETNPDLVHSREFNLDYLRMRMDEQVFHYAIINQVKVQIKQLITVALRPNTASAATVGVANTSGRNIDEIFDIYYETEAQGKRIKRVLFRIQVKLTKLPTQSTSNTIQQIIMCIEKFLNPSDIEDSWQPAIQGRVAALHWDQKAKPTPLLVLEQSAEGANVSFRSNPVKQQIAAQPKDTRKTPNKPMS